MGYRGLRRKWSFVAFACGAFVVGACVNMRMNEVPDVHRDLPKLREVPSAARLAEIAAQPLPERSDTKVVHVERWSFALSEEGADGEDGEPATPIVVPLAMSKVFSSLAPDEPTDEALHCVAEQVARFRLVHEGSPTDRLRHYIAAHCGGHEGVDVHLEGGVLESRDPAVIRGLAEAALRRGLAERGERGGERRYGAGLVQQGDRWSLALVSARARATLDPGSTEVDGEGRVRVSGRVTIDADAVNAVINRGDDFGYADCEREEVPHPAFSFLCQLDQADRQARIEVAAAPTDRLLAPVVATLVVHRDGPAAVRYPPSRFESKVTTNDQVFVDAILQQIGQIRRTAGLPALARLDRQSRVLEQLAPHVFAAIRVENDELADEIAMGIRAGWDVPHLIEGAAMTLNFGAAAYDVGAWLDDWLDRPFVRRTVMRADRGSIAIGLARDYPWSGLGSVVATYDELQRDEGADLALLERVLNERRALRGVSAVHVLRKYPALDEAVAEVGRGAHPFDVLDEARENPPEGMADVDVGYVAGGDLEEAFPFRPEMIMDEDVRVAFRIAYRPRGESRWGMRVVLYAWGRASH